MRWTERTPVLLLSIQQPAWCWRLQNQSLSTLFSLFLTSLSAADITQVMFGIGKCFLQPWANTKCVQSTVCSNRNGDRLQVNPFLKEGFHQKGLRVLTDRPEFEMYMLIHKNQKSGLVTTLLALLARFNIVTYSFCPRKPVQMSSAMCWSERNSYLTYFTFAMFGMWPQETLCIVTKGWQFTLHQIYLLFARKRKFTLLWCRAKLPAGASGPNLGWRRHAVQRTSQGTSAEIALCIVSTLQQCRVELFRWVACNRRCELEASAYELRAAAVFSVPSIALDFAQFSKQHARSRKQLLQRRLEHTANGPKCW